MLPFLQLIIIIIIIVTAAKIGGLISLKLGQPAVVGEVLVGLILGPSVLNLLHWSIFTAQHLGETIKFFAELGILLLMFIAGLNLHLSDLAQSGKAAVWAGILGFALAVALGFVLATALSYEADQALFIGLVLAPTSISIAAQTLTELGVLRSRVGVTLLGAAAVDDSLGVLGLSLFFAFLGGDGVGGLTSAALVLVRMILFLVVASAAGLLLIPRLCKFIETLPISQGLIAFAFTTMLLYAWVAEVLGSMAMIIGAFMAGLFFARSPLKERIERQISPLTYGVFVPIFFVSVGLSADVRQLSSECLALLMVMCIAVIVSRLLASALAGRAAGWPGREAIQLGVGMIPRGEVTLIVATIGMIEGLIGREVFSTAVGMVIVTTLLTPPLLRGTFVSAESSNVSLQEIPSNRR
jgi:Kef-type K+ transport system membrane component KefB